MKSSFKFFSLWLLLALGAATLVFNSCGHALLSQGVVINGVKWATSNVDAAGTFAAKPEDPGMFYQWNRKTAWPITNEVSDWDSSIPTGDTWEKANDPCPAGWRMPTLDEIKTLLDIVKVESEWITQNGVNGRKFTDKATGNSIFLPAAGGRWNGNDDGVRVVGLDGYYWTGTKYDSNSSCYLNFAINGYIGWDYRSNLGNGYSVRAVAK